MLNYVLLCGGMRMLRKCLPSITVKYEALLAGLVNRQHKSTSVPTGFATNSTKEGYRESDWTVLSTNRLQNSDTQIHKAVYIAEQVVHSFYMRCSSMFCSSNRMFLMYFVAVPMQVFVSHQSSGYSLCWMNLQVLLHYRPCVAHEGVLVYLSLFRWFITLLIKYKL